jgi:hypothetical protein
MTIWVLAVVLLASVAALGFRQGAVRVAFSFAGILVGALLAVPLGHLLGRLLAPLGVKDPILVWALGPLLVFIICSMIFKGVAAAVHHKVDVYYKYHAGDLRLALWERLNHRLGLCLGLLNGASYLILIAFVIYVPSYVTVQVATSDEDPQWMRILNRLGKDLHGTGFAKVGRSLDSIPQVDYDMVDLGAVLYRNSLLEARLGSYPAFLGLAERQEFKDIANDNQFRAKWQSVEPVMSMLQHPHIQAIRGNPELLKTIWTTTEANLSDLRAYLDTGRSAKYDPIRILGRWYFDVSAVMRGIRRAKPTMPSSEMQRVRQSMESAYSKASLVAQPDNQILMKDAPVKGAGGGPQTVQGQWKDADGKYQLSFPNLEVLATVEGDRLTYRSEGTDMVFARED